MSFKIYKLKEEYSTFLRKYDNKIPINKNETRPYIGVLLEINNKVKYFAPLSSPKIKHRNMKTQIDFIKIDGGNLGIINLNNAIPIEEKDITVVDINKLKNSKDIDDRKYGNLCDDQLYWCNFNRINIKEKFEKLYNLFMENKLSENIKDRCCNFKLLEEKCLEYAEISKLNKNYDTKENSLDFLIKNLPAIRESKKDNNYNIFTGNQILVPSHSSKDRRWIPTIIVEKENIQIKENEKAIKGILTNIQENKLYVKPIEYYNVSQLYITKELEQKFVPMKEKTIKIEKDRGIER